VPDLSEKALEELITELKDGLGKNPISITPTKLWVPKYPDETDEEYLARVERAKELERTLRA
jgi:hypothetical protein